MLMKSSLAVPPAVSDYILEDQVGFILRQVAQRHAAIFTSGIDGDITPTQWAALAKLREAGPLSQNLLGRHTVMDGATIKGVIDRLLRRGLVEARPHPEDGRRRLIELTEAGRGLVDSMTPRALLISTETLAPLDAGERQTFVRMLLKLR